jgi:hypothetical protein
VTLWARLTWQASDARSLAASLGERLGIEPRPGGLVRGAFLLRLGGCELEVRPWVSEGPQDIPRPGGRLMLEPVPNGEEAPDALPGDPFGLHALGWGTVELERAEGELDPWIGDAAPGPRERPDPHLGARVVLRRGAGLPGAWTALLEPSTEGAISASLARDGEGPCALYLRPAIGLDAWLAATPVGEGGQVREGPFGRQVLLRGTFTGPHLLVTQGLDPAGIDAATGTIPA